MPPTRSHVGTEDPRNKSLEGRTALLVGAGTGIGRACVDACLADGAKVVALEIDPDKCEELGRLGSDVEVVPGDATRLVDNRRAVDIALQRFGRLDTLACFVGVFDYYLGIEDLPEDRIDAAFDEIFRTNVLSHLLAVKAAVHALRANRGSIVLTLSTSSFYPGRGGILYLASKHAGVGLVRGLAHELAPDVRVNGVAPGGTTGTDLRGLDALNTGARSLGAAAGRTADIAARVPLSIAMDGDDHAGAYVFLASDRSRATTGTVVHSDGGVGIGGA